jgi:membrane associated rhomboid family serine protease
MNNTLYKGKRNLTIPARFVFLMWLFFSLQYYLAIDLGYLGIVPRTLSGLIGVLMAPLIHGSFGHILANTFPVFILAATLFYFFPGVALRVFFQCYFITNFFVWLMARPFFHIGASGLVYAMAFFLISIGIFKRDFKSMAIAILVLILYGGLFYNITIINTSISYESHVIGAIVGIGTAFGIVKSLKKE